MTDRNKWNEEAALNNNLASEDLIFNEEEVITRDKKGFNLTFAEELSDAGERNQMAEKQK